MGNSRSRKEKTEPVFDFTPEESSAMLDNKTKDSSRRNSITIDDARINDHYQDLSLFCLTKKSRPRRWFIKISSHPYFDRVTMFVIFVNCVTLGAFDPYDHNCVTTKCQVLEIFEMCIFVYFVLEMLIKIIAFGFLGPKGYIADTWNKLDFFIVSAGIFEQCYGDGEFLSSIRAIRVLRPLRAINRVPSIRILVTLLIDTLPMLGNVLILCILILMVFAIIGVQLWQGLLRNRCGLQLPNNITDMTSLSLPSYYQGKTEWSLLCSFPGDRGEAECNTNSVPAYRVNSTACDLSYEQGINGSYMNLTRTNSSVSGCINWNRYYSRCERSGNNPHFGAITFDNTGLAFIAIFQTITLEGWTVIMYYLQDVYSNWVWIYFVALVFIGSYFMTNLCLVVVATQFTETREREEKLIQAALLNQSQRSINTEQSSNVDGQGCYNQVLSYIAHLCRKTMRKIRRKLFAVSTSSDMSCKSNKKLPWSKNKRECSIHFHHHHHHHYHHHHLHLCPGQFTTSNLQKHNDVHADEDDGLSVVPENCNFDTTQQKFDPVRQLDRAIKVMANPSLEHSKSNSIMIPETTVFICHSSGIAPHTPTADLHTPSGLLDSIGTFAASSHHSVSGSSRTCSVGHDEARDEKMNYDADCELCQRKFRESIPGWESNDDGGDEKEEDKKKGCCTRSRNCLKWICESNAFKIFIMGSIFINTITLASEHHNQPDVMTRVLEIFNIVFTVIFALEFLLKFVGYGFYGYIKEAFNVFDCVIVIISLVELFGSSEGGGMSVLRTFRLMRVFKLVRFLPALQSQIKVMLSTLDNVVTFLGLLAIFMFTFAILGMHLFGAKMVDVETNVAVRHNFDNLMWSLITVFQVLTQENWNWVLYDAMRYTTKWASVYFIMLMVLGNYILFNLLVAILIEGFSNDSEERKRLEDEATAAAAAQEFIESRNEQFRINSEKLLVSRSLPDIIDNESMQREQDENLLSEKEDLGILRSNSESALNKYRLKSERMDHSIDNNDEADVEEEVQVNSLFSKREDWSLYAFSPAHRVRVLCTRAVSSSWFDYVVLAFISANCIILAMERPSIEADSTERKVITVSNLCFAAVFMLEMIIKVIDMGFVIGNGTYLRSGWNVLDFSLVMISLVDIIVTYGTKTKSGILGMLKVLRAFRTLRPLRLISRAPGIKIVVETLLTSLVPIGNLLIVALVFFVIFGILGVQLFKGQFWRCTGLTVPVVNKTECLSYGGNWKNKVNNFDNLAQALMTLFVFSTADGWVNLMYDGVDSVGVDKQPILNHNPSAFIYFVSFLLVAGFVVINMLVGVIIDNFTICQKKIMAGMSEQEDESSITKNNEIPENLSEYGMFRRAIYAFVSHIKFDIAIAVIIGLNVLLMAIEHYDMSKELTLFLKVMNYIFTAIFILESALKIIGYGYKFFYQHWNQLDLVIVLLSIMGIIFEELNTSLPINPTIIRIMRVLRIARILKILKAAGGVQSLLNCVSCALPEVVNLLGLFLLIFFIFSALGIEIYGKLDCNLDICYGINRHAHFRNFGYAMLTLFRISTGDNWSGFFKDALNPKLCPVNCDAMKFISPPFFFFFVCATQFVLVNVVVAVLMKQLEDSKNMTSPIATVLLARSRTPSINTLASRNRDSISTSSQISKSSRRAHQRRTTVCGSYQNIDNDEWSSQSRHRLASPGSSERSNSLLVMSSASPRTSQLAENSEERGVIFNPFPRRATLPTIIVSSSKNAAMEEKILASASRHKKSISSPSPGSLQRSKLEELAPAPPETSRNHETVEMSDLGPISTDVPETLDKVEKCSMLEFARSVEYKSKDNNRPVSSSSARMDTENSSTSSLEILATNSRAKTLTSRSYSESSSYDSPLLKNRSAQVTPTRSLPDVIEP